MSDQYIGEIRIFAGKFAPAGWAFCDGQSVLIDQNPILYSIIRTNYGGDGMRNFQLPDLRGRVPFHVGASNGSGLSERRLGEALGADVVALHVSHLPPHRHVGSAGSDSRTSDRPGPRLAPAAGGSYGPAGTGAGTAATQSAGTANYKENMQPSLGLNFIIALDGIYPAHS